MERIQKGPSLSSGWFEWYAVIANLGPTVTILKLHPVAEGSQTKK
jgi:hypothetical protein